MRNLTFLVSALLLLSTSAQGQENIVGFINGVFSTEESAREHASDIAEAYRISQGKTATEFYTNHEWMLFYNDTACPEGEDPNILTYGSCVADLFEAGVQQGTIQNARTLWELEDSIVRANPTVELSEELLQQVTDALIDFSESVIDEHTLGIRNEIRLAASSGRRIALVMHSQGNFFGNDAWSLLQPEYGARVHPISVATPDDHVEGGGPYRTVQCDFIHNTPGALDEDLIPSISCGFLDLKCSFLTCHALTTYLAEGGESVSTGVARERILGDISTVFEEPELPGPVPPPTSPIVSNGSFSLGTVDWILNGDFWAGTNLSNFKSSPGYAAGGVDQYGYHKNGASGSMSQFVEIPTGYSSATFITWINITTDETQTGVFDEMTIEFFEESGVPILDSTIELSNRHATYLRDYHRHEVDLSDYIGEAVLIRFSATSDGSLPTVFRIDDVSISVE